MPPGGRSARELEEGLRRLANGDGDRDRSKLLHEIKAYQEQLLVQNEELTHAQAALEETRDRFVDLYDFAPNGYLALDPYGVVLQINLTGAAMIGCPRQSIEGLPLIGFVEKGERTLLIEFIRQCRRWSSGPAPSADLRLPGKDGARCIQLLCTPRGEGRRREYLTSMVDITARKELEREQARAADEYGALASRLISVQDEERQRIARDLHDNIGQLVTALRLKLSDVQSKLDAPFNERIADCERLVDELDRQLDFIARELRPAVLDLGVATAIEQFVSEWSELFGIAAEVHVQHDPELRRNPTLETHFYRVTQEALHNIYKHARASRVSVLLERKADDVVLIVEDNGDGFEPENVKASGSAGMGLLGMRERAQIVGGSIEVESSPGQGTTLYFRVPVPAALPTSET